MRFAVHLANWSTAIVVALAVIGVGCGASGGPARQPARASHVETDHQPIGTSTTAFDQAMWRSKLADPRTAMQATAQLRSLGDPAAITLLGEAWLASGRPTSFLAALIELAEPLTPGEATGRGLQRFAANGRPPSWTAALPFLIRAVSEVDALDERSVDAAGKAADALGEANQIEAVDALIALASLPVDKRTIGAQVSAIRALGKQPRNPKPTAALIELLERSSPQHPRDARDLAQRASRTLAFELYLRLTGATINALGELRDPAATSALVLQMYETPELFTQIRRALLAIGPAAKDQLRKAIRGEHREVNKLFSDRKLGQSCDRSAASRPTRPTCVANSAKDFYAAVVLGDFYDPAVAPELVAAAKRPPRPVYYHDGQPSPNSQHHAIFDALRKIGAPGVAAQVRAMALRPPANRDAPAVEMIRILAISAYPFVARDDSGVHSLGAIAADNNADDTLRQEAATAFARLSRDDAGIKILDALAQKYFDASTQKRREADGKPKADAAAADKQLEAAKQVAEAAQHKLATMGSTASVADIKRENRSIADALKAARTRHKAAIAEFKALDGASKAYKAYARMFQTHIARIEIAIRCKDDLGCYAASLTQTPDQAASNCTRFIKDIDQWTAEEKRGLLEANVERAMLEIGKRGAAAGQLVPTLLDHVTSDNRLIRQSILLALPKIATLPCDVCATKLDEAIRAGEAKPALADLNLETTILRNYFRAAAAPAK
ncbi:MAG: hypothetical protein AB7P03_00205 [Kofleriaceae bacterium]